MVGLSKRNAFLTIRFFIAIHPKEAAGGRFRRCGAFIRYTRSFKKEKTPIFD